MKYLLVIAAMLVATYANAETCSERVKAVTSAVISRGEKIEIARPYIQAAFKVCMQTGVWDTTGGGTAPHGRRVENMIRK